MTPTITDAIRSLGGSNTAFSIDNGKITRWDYSETKSNVTQPTQAEIDAELVRLTGIYNSNDYQRTRELAYKKVKEQLDQLYHDMTAGKLDATGEWHKAIKAVKDATPKP